MGLAVEGVPGLLRAAGPPAETLLSTVFEVARLTFCPTQDACQHDSVVAEMAKLAYDDRGNCAKLAIVDRMARKTWSVYGMYDPLSAAVRYVGATSQDLGRRLSEHMARAKYKNTPQPRLAEWILGLLAQGLRPEMRLLLECDSPDRARMEETKAIYAMASAGACLLNSHLVREVARNRRKWRPAKNPLIRLDPKRGVLVW